MFKHRRYYRCDCGRCFKITIEKVETIWKAQGSKYTNYEYFIICPECHYENKVKMTRLPLPIIFDLLKSRCIY